MSRSGWSWAFRAFAGLGALYASCIGSMMQPWVQMQYVSDGVRCAFFAATESLNLVLSMPIGFIHCGCRTSTRPKLGASRLPKVAHSGSLVRMVTSYTPGMSCRWGFTLSTQPISSMKIKTDGATSSVSNSLDWAKSRKGSCEMLIVDL